MVLVTININKHKAAVRYGQGLMYIQHDKPGLQLPITRARASVSRLRIETAKNSLKRVCMQCIIIDYSDDCFRLSHMV